MSLRSTLLILLAFLFISPCDVKAETKRPKTFSTPKGWIFRSEADVLKLIQEKGKSKPDWWNKETGKDPSKMNWVDWGKGKWDTKRRPGPYFWGIVRPNPSKHKLGIKEYTKALALVKAKGGLEKKIAGEIILPMSGFYADTLHDYARAAYWIDEALKGYVSSHSTEQSKTSLAFYYYRLGSKSLALKILKMNNACKYRTTMAKTIRCYCLMGETDLAIAFIKLKVIENKTGKSWAKVYLASGDTFRNKGNLEEAIRYYQQTAKMPTRKQKRPMRALIENAKDLVMLVKVVDKLDLKKVKNGTYKGKGKGYKGDVETSVQIKDGIIVSTKVTKTKEDQPLNTQIEIPRRIIEKQGIKGVDTLTGATITSRAIIVGATKAISEAMK